MRALGAPSWNMAKTSEAPIGSMGARRTTRAFGSTSSASHLLIARSQDARSPDGTGFLKFQLSRLKVQKYIVLHKSTIVPRRASRSCQIYPLDSETFKPKVAR